MAANSRFRMGVHVLAVLARLQQRGPVCSPVIASSVNTNPVVIRRLMAKLEAAGLVMSVPGRRGGFMLARSALSITLADIYRAFDDEGLFHAPRNRPSSACPVGAHIEAVLERPLQAASEALEQTLARTTLAELHCGIPAG